MNAEDLLKLINHPELLEEFPLSDLEVLKFKYPYSKNIQLLYLKKLKLLGLTQNEKDLNKIKFAHNHPVLLDKILQNDTEEFQSINTLYDNIFKEIEKEETQPQKEIKTISLQPAKIKNDTPPPVETNEPTINQDDLNKIEEQIDGKPAKTIVLDHKKKLKKLEAKIEKEEIQEVKSQQFDEEKNEKTEKSNTDIKYIEVEEFTSKKKKKKAKSKATKEKPTKLKKKDSKKKKDNNSKKKKKKKELKSKNIKAKKQKEKKTKKPTKPASIKKDLQKDMSYFDWLDSLKSTAEILGKPDHIEKKAKKKKVSKKKKKAKKKSKLQNKIDSSLQLNNQIYTETLAELMENQGHHSQAINIYKQLMLNNPEKSDYFAGRIEKLK